MVGPALFLGKVGSTGRSTGPHAHWEILKDGKRFPLSKTRKDIGQYIQFRLPNQQAWQNLYSSKDFTLNPAAQLTSAMGPRIAPASGASTNHQGEDYGFPEGTSLRFLGRGSVSTYANMGSAGNVSTLQTGPYELKTFHLSELPLSATIGKNNELSQFATSRKNDASRAALSDSEAWAQAYVQNQITNRTHQEQQGKLVDALLTILKEKEKPKPFMEQVKEGLISSALSQVLTPKNFLTQFTNFDPYLQGQQYATSQFFGL
jgi:hypothetical protein